MVGLQVSTLAVYVLMKRSAREANREHLFFNLRVIMLMHVMQTPQVRPAA